jgi:hypothetical protein
MSGGPLNIRSCKVFVNIPWTGVGYRWSRSWQELKGEASGCTLRSTGTIAECQSLATKITSSPGLKGKTRAASMAASANIRKRRGLST